MFQKPLVRNAANLLDNVSNTEDRVNFLIKLIRKKWDDIFPILLQAIDSDTGTSEIYTSKDIIRNRVASILRQKDDAKLLEEFELLFSGGLFYRKEVEAALLATKKNSRNFNHGALNQRLADFFKVALAGRYNITLHGAEHMEHYGPVALLARHEALIDPVMIISYLSKLQKVSPVVFQAYYNNPLLKPLLKIIEAIPVADVLWGGSTQDAQKLHKVVIEALKKGTTTLWYPSGKLPRENIEWIGNATLTYNVAHDSETPKSTKYVTARYSDGLWWSTHSNALWNGNIVEFLKSYGFSIWVHLSNLWFLTPKKDIDIFLEDVTDLVKSNKGKSLKEFNWALEAHLGQGGPHELTFTPHWHWFHPLHWIQKLYLLKYPIDEEQLKKLPWSIASLKDVKQVDTSMVSQEVKVFICTELTRIKGTSVGVIEDTSHLTFDVGLDSIGMTDIVETIASKYNIENIPSFDTIKTVGDLYMIAIGKAGEWAWLKDCNWKERSGEAISLLEKLTWGEKDIVKLVMREFSQNPDEDFMWDDTFGMITKWEFLKSAKKMSFFIRWLKAEKIGIMLPASCAATLSIFATLLAGKTPVLLNFSAREDGFQKMIDDSKIDTILSSEALYKNLKDKVPYTKKYEWSYIFLEDVKKAWWKIQRASFETEEAYAKAKETQSRIKKAVVLWAIKSVVSFWNRGLASILYTSGSWGIPKGVALTDENIIEDLRWALSLFSITNKDIILSALPPFHSLWFTVKSIMPLVTGCRVAYTPNPLDARSILNNLKHTKATAMATTPWFLKAILAIATPEDLVNLKYVVVGSAKCPVETFEKFAELCPHGVILEGYGITECSPVLALNPIAAPKKGSIGKIIPWVKAKLVHPLKCNDEDIIEEVSQGQTWLLLVSGKNIFKGYTDPKIKSPFVKDGEATYFNTWDLVSIDEEWYVFFKWKFWRTPKNKEGEMLQIESAEEVLQALFPNTGENAGLPSCAIEYDFITGQEGTADEIVLFTTRDDITKEIANKKLWDSWERIVKITQVVKVPEIKLLGSAGKIDYQDLKKQIVKITK